MSWQAMAWAQKAGKDYQLSPTARLTLLTMANYADPEGRDIYPSIPTMVDDTGLSERTLRRHYSHLCDIGILSVGDQRAAQHIPAGKRPTVYRFEYAGRKDPERAPFDPGTMPGVKNINGELTPASCPADPGIDPGTMPGNTYKPKSNTPAAPAAAPEQTPAADPAPSVDPSIGAAFRAEIERRRLAKQALRSNTANDNGVSA